MPKMPKMLADAMESLFSSLMHPVEVQQTNYLFPTMKEVVFAGDALKNVKYQPGWEIEFRVNDTDYRHYTPSFFDPIQGICHVLFYLHDQGPGSRWANELQPGNKTKLMGPGKKIELDRNQHHYVFLGDETTVGLFLELQRGLNDDQSLAGAIEADHTLPDLAQRTGLQLDTIYRNGKPGDVLLDWLASRVSTIDAAKFYIAGHAQSIQRVRNYLKGHRVLSSQIVTRPYWATGKVGL